MAFLESFLKVLGNINSGNGELHEIASIETHLVLHKPKEIFTQPDSASLLYNSTQLGRFAPSGASLGRLRRLFEIDGEPNQFTPAGPQRGNLHNRKTERRGIERSTVEDCLKLDH